MGSVPHAMIIVDPQSGEIKQYPLNEIPEWVDRVYSEHVVQSFLTWWGRWEKAPWKFAFETTTDRTKPAGERPILVYTKGGHPAWQVLMRSQKDDNTSVIGIVLFEGRSNTAKLYDVSGIAAESDVLKAFEKSGKNLRGFTPVHPSLHKIYGELTWVVAYISPDTNRDQAEPFQSIGLLHSQNIDGANVVMETTMSKALAAYRRLLVQGTSSQAPEENSRTKMAKGVVVDVATAVIEGYTHYFITLDSDSRHVFEGVMTSERNLELPFVKQGSSVVITYLDVGKARVDIMSYDDLGRNLD